jgi:hypothetical protein
VDRAFTSEAYAPRVQEFTLETKKGDHWKPFASGEQIGVEKTLRFEPVTVQVVRLKIVEATEAPTIWKFQLFCAQDAQPGKSDTQDAQQSNFEDPK